MKKKTLAAFIAVVLIFNVFSLAMTAFAADTSPIPTIYMRGRGTEIYDDPFSENRQQLYPFSYPDDYIMNQVKKVLPILFKCIAKNDYDEYCDALYNSVAPIFEPIRLDNNGEASDGSGVDWTWDDESIIKAGEDGSYDIYDLVFRYDWRIDPCQVAEQLSDYIEGIKRVSGFDKVNIICRC